MKCNKNSLTGGYKSRTLARNTLINLYWGKAKSKFFETNMTILFSIRIMDTSSLGYGARKAEILPCYWE